MNSYVVYIVLAILIIFFVVSSVSYITAAWKFVKFTTTFIMVAGTNDQTIPSRVTLEMLGQAKRNLLLLDHGNEMGGSFYYDDEFKAAVVAKIQENKDFKLTILLTEEPSKNSWVHELSKKYSDRFTLTVDSKLEKPNVHAKIADDGEMGAYTSVHEVGQENRPYRWMKRRNKDEVFNGYIPETVTELVRLIKNDSGKT